jgi:hypothetical protein
MRKPAFPLPSGDILGQLVPMAENSMCNPAGKRRQPRPDALGETARGSR